MCLGNLSRSTRTMKNRRAKWLDAIIHLFIVKTIAAIIDVICVISANNNIIAVKMFNNSILF